MLYPQGFCYTSEFPKLRRVNVNKQIYCRVRKRWLKFSAEEFVRQAFISTLIHVYKVPAGSIQVEREMALHHVHFRFDLVVFKPNTKPWLLAELKAPDVVLNESTLHQALRYNLVLQSPWLLLSNGISEYVYKEGLPVKSLMPYTADTLNY